MVKTYKKVDECVRNLIIKGYEDGRLMPDLAKTFDVNLSTVRSIIQRFKKFGKIVRPRGHRPKKLNDDQVKELKDFVDQDCQKTLEQIRDYINDKFEINLSLMSIQRYLDDIHYSLKRVSIVPERRNSSAVIQQRYEYAIRFLDLDIEREKIFFLDECGVAIHCRTNYGRSRIGTRANVRVRAVRGKNFSICAAMHYNGLYYYKCQPQSYNTNDFIIYLKEFFDKIREDEIGKIYLIMDNVRFHHAASVEELIKETNHELIFLPAYSPFLNPIENMFNQLKHYVKRFKPKSAEEVYNGVELASECISEQDCNNHYANMKKYLNLCVRKIPIEN